MLRIQSLKLEPTNVTLAQMLKSKKVFEELLLLLELEAFFEVGIYKKKKDQIFIW